MTPSIPTGVTDRIFSNPITYGLTFLLVLVWLISEITGKTHGIVNQLLERRRKQAEDRATEAAKPDPRVVQLEQAAAFQERLLKDAMATIARLDSEVNDLRRDRDRQGVLLTAHLAWDRNVQAVLAERGIDVPTPAPLFVTDEETP